MRQQLAFSLLRHAQARLRLHFASKSIAVVRDGIPRSEVDEDGFEVVDAVKTNATTTFEGFEMITKEDDEADEKREGDDCEDFEVIEKLEKCEDKLANGGEQGTFEYVGKKDFPGDSDILEGLVGGGKMRSRGEKYLEQIVETATFATQYTALLVGLEALVPRNSYMSNESGCEDDIDSVEGVEGVQGRDGNVKLDNGLGEQRADYMRMGELVDGEWEA